MLTEVAVAVPKPMGAVKFYAQIQSLGVPSVPDTRDMGSLRPKQPRRLLPVAGARKALLQIRKSILAKEKTTPGISEAGAGGYATPSSTPFRSAIV